MIKQLAKKFYLQIKNYFKAIAKIKISQVFHDWSLFEIIWLFISVLILAVISITTTTDYLLLTVIATITGMLNLILVAKGKVLNFFFGLINNLAYAYVCYQQGIYGQFLLFLFWFFPMQFYGFYSWTKLQNVSANNNLNVRVLSNFHRVILVVGILIAAIFYGVFILKGYFNQQIGLIPDSLTGVVSVVAIVLMVKAFVEQWQLWIVINTLSTIIWLQEYFQGSGEGLAFLAMWLIYLFNAIYGYINWQKLHKHEH